MKKSALPANRGEVFGQFRVSDAQRIASVVHIVETARRERNPSRLPRAAGGGGGFARLCKTPCAFPKNSVATLDVWESGTPPNETITAGETIENVVNKYGDIAAGKFVSVLRHGNGRWYVIAADCS